MSVLLYSAETEMESLTSSTTALIYQTVIREMRTEIRKVRCDMSIICSFITACPNWELGTERI